VPLRQGVCYTFKPLHVYLGMDCQKAVTSSELDELEKEHARTWLIYTLPVLFEANSSDLWGKVQNDYTSITKFTSTVGGGDIVIMMNSTKIPRNGTDQKR
jgi:hypothetical protein